MTDQRDTQAIAARLTAIAERLKNGYWTHAGHVDQDALTNDLKFVSAHVETLTQQVAELERKETGYKVAIENLKHSIRALGDQVNKDGAELETLRSRFEAKTDTNLLQKQAEQQRDTAHAALKRIRGWDMLDATADGPFWKRELDAALAASAPQKEEQ
jgi:predicted RNase H-like nuclease (RuvC/YqgF family)